jgi:hypothetical protein
MKKTIKTITTAVVLTLILGLSSCKKGDTGPAGPTGTAGAQGQAGPQAKTFNFNLTFNAGDTFKSYAGVTGYDADDVLLFYAKYETLGTTAYWAPLPLILDDLVNIIPEFSETDGFVFINTLKADGTTGSPWASSATIAFKAVLIKSSQRVANPNVNLNNYEDVKKAYNLVD